MRSSLFDLDHESPLTMRLKTLGAFMPTMCTKADGKVIADGRREHHARLYFASTLSRLKAPLLDGGPAKPWLHGGLELAHMRLSANYTDAMEGGVDDRFELPAVYPPSAYRRYHLDHFVCLAYSPPEATTAATPLNETIMDTPLPRCRMRRYRCWRRHRPKGGW